MCKQFRTRARHAAIAAARVLALAPDAAQAGDLDQSQPVVDGALPVQGGDLGTRDNLPSGTQYVDATPSQESCMPPSKSVRQVICQLGDIADDGSATIALRVKVTAGAGSAYLNNVPTRTRRRRP